VLQDQQVTPVLKGHKGQTQGLREIQVQQEI
jgi:hypothetical protein